MTLPPVIRIFFAIDLPTVTKDKLATFVGALKKKSKTRAIRWSKSENLHITLQFLAEVRVEHLETLLANVRQQLVGMLRLRQLNLGALRLFPNPYHPRVIVLDVSPQEELAKLAILIGNGIKATNYEIETRPFRGHLTLGRIKHPHGVSLNFLSGCDLPVVENIEVSEVVLFRSEPGDGGSKYTPLERIALA